MQIRALIAVVVVALAVVASAAAKRTQVTVIPPTAAPHVDVPWTVTVHVAVEGKPYAKAAYRPTLYLVDKAGTQLGTFHGIRAAAGTFRVRIVFPHAGAWRYAIPDPVNGDWWFVAPKVAA